MMIGALAPYETSLAGAGPLAMLADDGDVITLDVERYLSLVDDADSSVLDRCRGPVLDVGCGPGRMVAALAERGMAALGVDIAPMAVELTRSRGGAVLLRDLFARVPGEGRWPTALVIDGNIGIGGDVDRVLRRLGALLAADGRAVVETAPAPATDRTLLVRFARGGVATGPQFAWSVIGADALVARAARVGFTVQATWSVDNRNFVELGRVQSGTAEMALAGAAPDGPGHGAIAPVEPRDGGDVELARVEPAQLELAPGDVAQLGTAQPELAPAELVPVELVPVELVPVEHRRFRRGRVGRGPARMAHPRRRPRGA